MFIFKDEFLRDTDTEDFCYNDSDKLDAILSIQMLDAITDDSAVGEVLSSMC